MTDQSADLVTKIDVIPELEGLNSFDAAIERAIAKVNQLDAAIKRVNNLKPASPYAPTSTASMPSAATTAAVATIAATGANLVSRTPLAQKVARAAVEGTASGITEKISIPASNLYRLPHSNEFGGFLPPPGTGRSGGGFNVPPSGASGWSAGRTGGLAPVNDFEFSDARFQNALNRRSFGFESNWSSELDKYDAERKSRLKKTPVAESVEKASGGSFFSLDKLFASAATVWGGKEIFSSLADSLDSIQRQQAQIARLAQTTGDAKDAFFALNAAASDVKSDSGAFISTYTNMATATQKLGLSQEETIKATQGLVGALQLGGAETHTINDALYQMGQAFSSDRFGGDEFRSFMEAIGTMAPKVAEAFGTDVKGLRAMSQAGKLTSEIMIKAFQKMAATNLDLLKKQGWTWGQTMTVMKNDWQAFLAQATIGGEWQKFTDWAANTLIPLARSAEKEVAEFWSTLADESKTAILIGILGAVGAAFTALAIPVMAALWPFLAIGAAVWLVYEAFVEWKAWMDGEGGTIFDGLFGSFDEFERRYPNIVKGLRAIRDGIAGAAKTITQGATTLGEPEGGWDQESKAKKDRYEANDAGGFDVIEKILSLFNGEGHPYETNALGKEQLSKKLSSGLVDPFTLEPITKSGANINNNVNNVTNINVNSAQEAADVRNSLDNPGVINYGSDNLAEGVGAR
ncbi:tape measure protein [Salmonella enterica]|nr:tape measure protein [Salmonella enterica]EIN2115565.1 tape measure protein [Salmonella enterica]EIX4966026.1 tape measure protein [Salmonella enterica]